MSGRLLLPLMLALALAAVACGEAPKDSPGQKTEAKSPAAPAAAPVAAAGGDAGSAPRINPTRALQYVREIVALGPRPVGSSGHRKLEDYLRARLKGDNVEVDEFTAATPAGAFPLRNYIARYPGSKDGVVVIATHYDTLYARKDFVGANDGASGSGLLLELANQLRGRREGPSVWLVWLDGEEAFERWSATDSVYGSRHLAEKWQKDGTAKQLRAFLLLDMIGDADLNIDRDSNSTPALLKVVEQAATRLGYQSHFFRREIAVEDDHQPFAAAGVPVADLIDFDYGYNNAFWHTPEDTLDKVSPRSLEIVGDVVLESVRLLGQ
jgi:Zn-dependent M28 family amino/carboxypeptidase